VRCDSLANDWWLKVSKERLNALVPAGPKLMEIIIVLIHLFNNAGFQFIVLVDGYIQRHAH
jgi:hypothetical protein